MLVGFDRNPSAGALRNFGITMICGFGIVGTLLWWMGSPDDAPWAWAGSWRQWVAALFWILGPLALIITLASPTAGRALYIGWMTFGMVVGSIMMPVGLTLLFIVLLPIFSLIRLADPLRKKLLPEGSYWEDHGDYEHTIERNMRQF